MQAEPEKIYKLSQGDGGGGGNDGESEKEPSRGQIEGEKPKRTFSGGSFFKKVHMVGGEAFSKAASLVASVLLESAAYIRGISWREAGSALKDKKTWRRCVAYCRRNTLRSFSAAFIFLFFVFYAFIFRAPANFPTGVIVTIERGQSVRATAEMLEREKIVRSSSLFKGLIRLISGNGFVIAGDYFFSRHVSVWEVALRVSSGKFGLSPIEVTVPEGANIFDVAVIFQRRFGRFDPVDFLRKVRDKEGYLFPDTYFFLPNVEAREVIKMLEDNFDAKITSIQKEISASGRSLGDIITMASILEKEARKPDERRVISGILWKRIGIGMALQVDATFQYINGKNTFELTLDDLNIDSPYNTYKNKGLPEGPIANPGLDAILAALEPKKTNYLFYLHGRDGVIRYAESFEGHKANKERYLD